MSGQRSPRGLSTSLAAFSAITHAESIKLPSGSIARRAPLESAQLRNAALDVIKVAFAFLFVLVTGLAFVASFFMCFLCRF